MKWIGQSIVDFIARFRSDVYLDGPTAGGSDPDKFLGIDSNNKIIYRTGAEVLSDIGASSTTGDITSVTAGTNCSGGGATGDVTINVDDAFLVNNASDTTTGTITADGFTTAGTLTLDEDTSGTVGITTVQDSGTSFADNDSSFMTAAAVDDRILDYGYSTTTGDITGVTLTADDENAATDTAGSADFIIAGGAGIDTTSDGESTVTITGETASDSNAGIVELATTAETNTGTDTGRAVTPAGLTAWTGDTALVTVGTIGTGTWEGTAVATDQQKHLACFQFKGYGTSDGTNYDISVELTDNQAPFQHDTSTGSDGLTAQTTSVIIRSGGIVMPHTGVLKKFTGWVTSQGTGTVDVGIFKVTPVDNNNSNVTPVLLVNEQITAAGNTKMRSFSETSSFDAGFTAGDIIYSAVNGGTASKLWYMNSILEVEWS